MTNLDEGVQGVGVSASVVVGRGPSVLLLEVLERRVALHTVLLAEVLLDGAVHVGDQDGGGALVLGGEVVPVRGELLAVSAP